MAKWAASRLPFSPIAFIQRDFLTGNYTNYKNADTLEEYEINSAKNIIIKKSNGMEEQDIIQYLLKKGYKLHLIKIAIEKTGE